MIRYYEFRDADGVPGMNGQQLHGASARDTMPQEINNADKHLLHHVRVYGWTDVVAYHPNTPLPVIMRRANAIRAEKDMDPRFSDEEIKRADPQYKHRITIHRIDANGLAVPVICELGPDHTTTKMAAPIAGVPIAVDDPAHPLIKHAAPAE